MAKRIDAHHSEEVTEATRKEFQAFVEWYNKKLGNLPLIVGGWAVYAYVPSGRGSRDIDVVYPSAEMRDRTLRSYWLANGYREEKLDLFTVSYQKELRTRNGAIIAIHIDPFCKDEDTVDKRTGIRLSWRLADKHCVEKRLDGVSVYVPEAELLAAYKIGAILKREKEMEETPDKAWADHLASKIVKDAYDLVQLFSNCNLGHKRVSAFCEYLEITPGQLKACGELVKRHKEDAGIEESVKKFEEEFARLHKKAAGKTG